MITPIAAGTENWNTPLEANMADLQNQVTRSKVWINVKDYGAKVDSATDDTSAIQAAINACPRGGIVYIPGLSRTSSPLTLPPRTTLLGSHAPHWPQYARDTPMIASGIKALAGFVGVAMVVMLDKAQGGWPETYMSSARITNLTIDGGNIGTNVAGIYASGQVVDTALSNVCITNVTGHGLYTDTNAGLQPKGWSLDRVSIQSSNGAGFYHANTAGSDFAVTDMTYTSCWAGANGGDGWHFESALSVDLNGCRSEFNSGYGYYAAGSSRMRFIDCDTDRSAKSGWRLECQGTGQRSIIISGCIANRDGANDDITPAGYAAFDIVGSSNFVHNPVAITGCVVNVNHNDQGTGIYSPDYGLKVTYAPQVSVSGTHLNGTVAAMLDSQDQVAYDSTTRFNTTSPSTGATTLEKANTQRLIGLAGTNRDIEFWTSTVGKRWALRASSTAESGSNVGTNFAIARYDDSGTVIDTPLAIARSSGSVTMTSDVRIGTAGKGLQVAEGTNAKQGISVLVAGTVTVSNTAVTANSRIQLTIQVPGGTVGAPYINARTAGTSFVIKSTSATDTSTVAWLIVEP